MKPVQFIMVVILLATLCLAQSKAPQGQNPPAQKPATGQQTPGQQTPAAQQPAAPQPPPGRRLPPQARTNEEFQAYQEAAKATDAAASDKAAEDFAAKFPQSELRFLLYYKAMSLYQAGVDNQKAIDTGRKALAAQPNDPLTLAIVATLLAENTRDTDLDKEQRLGEALADAQKSLQTVDTDLLLPANVPLEQVEINKGYMRSLAYAAIGNVNAGRENFKAAEDAFRESIKLNTLQPSENGITWLRLSLVLDREKKYPDALVAANKALEIFPAGSQQATLAKQERDRLLQLTGAQVPPASPAQTPPKK
jgi:tetratricopeptide (TPR) repeat protein